MAKNDYGLTYIEGASHGDDLGYLFHWKNPPQDLHSNSTLRERKLMRTMIKMWTNFAKTGYDYLQNVTRFRFCSF